MMMTLLIEDFSFECVIGIMKEERVKTQKVEITAHIKYEPQSHGFLDYMKLCREIKKEFTVKKFRLLEEAAVNVCEMLKSKNPAILSVSIKIIKPEIRNDAKVGIFFEKSFS